MLNEIFNEYLIKNLTDILFVVFIGFTIAFLSTPIVGRIAKIIKVIDKPKYQRNAFERGYETRIHSEPKAKLGGLAMAFALLFTILISTQLSLTNHLDINYVLVQYGIIVGAIVIVVGGLLDDIFELNPYIQLFFQVLAASIVIVFSIGLITNINVLGINLNFEFWELPIQIGRISSFYIPAFVFTLFWILGMINVINWVGGIDGLNGTVSALASFTLLVISLSNSNFIISIIIAAHLGSVLGVLPFNYYPSKIFYGSIGDYLNGYLLSIFAILSGAKWHTTLILFALPIIDGLYVIYKRFRKYPSFLSKPWKVLAISDKNHFHHRLLDSGFSQKAVMFIESSFVLILCGFAILSTDLRIEFITIILGLIFIVLVFVIVFILKQRYELQQRLNEIVIQEEIKTVKKPLVSVVVRDGDNDNEEPKFIY
ncbi:MAG: hypothetical protein NZZ41_04395 [Candidatus Dojkabacteria bacterium]|nr:hypothetical protein [Candidatus Dojkabacteria bacterium]